MSAINFVVRSDAGVVERGAVAGLNGSSTLIAGQGQDISLNLERNHVVSYSREGQALRIMLVDGQVITIEGFFSPDGVAENSLFLSSAGQLAEVELIPGDGNLLYAQYADADSFGKWSPDDALYFLEPAELVIANVESDVGVGMLGVPLLGGLGGLAGPAALAAGAGALLLSGTSTGDNEGSGTTVSAVDPAASEPGEGEPTDTSDAPDPAAPVAAPVVSITDGTKSVGYVVNGEDHADGVTIAGSGTPGASGTITVGDVTQDVTVGGDGNWSVVIDPADIAGGEYETDVTVTLTTAGGSTSATDVVVLDTEAMVTFDASTVEGDGVVNLSEESDGFTLTGTTQPGSSVIVSFDGGSYAATVTGGTWTLDVPAGVVAQGEYDLDISVTATDTYGNTATASDTLRIDTVAEVSIDTSTVEGDGTVNFAEESDGFTLTGTTQPGSTVTVSFDGNSYPATVTGGTWTLDVPAGVIAQGEYDLTIDVTATDAFGNTATATDTLNIDTVTGITLDTSAAGGDGTVNAVEHPAGVTVNGLAEAGASVVVTMGSASHTVTASSAGTWTASFSASEVDTGTYDLPVTAISTDAAGNTATASGMVQVDTELDVTIDTSAAGGGDGVINFVERDGGVTLVGTSDPGASVEVTFEGVTRTTVADADGSWSADWASSEVRSGNVEVNAPVSAVATDAAGNVATTTGTVNLDTYVNRLQSSAGMVEGDDVVNNAEAADGITLTGFVEAGSTVMVTFEGTTRAATVDANGGWTVDFDAAEIPAGEYQTVVDITATDAAGNTASITDTFMVDTQAPDAPNIESYTEGHDGLRGIGIENTTDDITLAEYVEGGATASAVTANNGTFVNPGTGELNMYFDDGHAVPDGSQLVVTAGDDAGNTNSTLFVLDNITGSTVDVTAGALDGFNIGAIDLEFAEESQLTISAADIEALSANDNTLVIHGSSDDAVALAGTATADGTTVIDGKSYDVYSVGADGGRLIIGEDIDFTQSVV